MPDYPGDYAAALTRASGDPAGGMSVGPVFAGPVYVGPVYVAERPASRARGLLGRRHFDAALLIRPCRSVHTVGMSMAIDVAFLDGGGTVLDIVTVGPNRLTRPRRRARSVLETSAGRLAEWGVRPGDTLLVTPEQTQPQARPPAQRPTPPPAQRPTPPPAQPPAQPQAQRQAEPPA
jgi:uncharacterized membrane protein (UPF0127 family)